MTTALEGVRGQRYGPAALYPGKDPVPIAQEAGWAPGPVWTGAKNLAPRGIRSPDRLGRSQSLYRLRYPVHSNRMRTMSIKDVNSLTAIHTVWLLLCQFQRHPRSLFTVLWASTAPVLNQTGRKIYKVTIEFHVGQQAEGGFCCRL